MRKSHSIESGKDVLKEIQLLEDKIYDFNSDKTKRADGCLFSRIVRNETKEIIAGIAGWTWAGVCEITQLWVDKDARGLGIGKMLLESAETEARSKGCDMVLVKSYSFQAPHFYERYGYKIEHMLHDFPKDCSYYILLKRLTLQEMNPKND